jgi:hypothetical protein
MSLEVANPFCALAPETGARTADALSLTDPSVASAENFKRAMNGQRRSGN